MSNDDSLTAENSALLEQVKADLAASEGVRRKTFWTTENTAKLRQACDDGKSAKEIAEEVFAGAVTRDAVIGKRWRLGIKDDALTRAKKCARALRKQRKPRSAVRSKEDKPEPPAGPPSPTFNCSFIELTSKRCHNPIGQPSELRYCGAPVEQGSFCDWCSTIIYGRKRSRNEQRVAA
jgi:hypothetical protein